MKYTVKDGLVFYIVNDNEVMRYDLNRLAKYIKLLKNGQIRKIR